MKDNFEFWLKMVDNLALLNGYKTKSIVDEMGIEAWLPYFEQGFTPSAALAQAEFDSADAEAEVNGAIE